MKDGFEFSRLLRDDPHSSRTLWSKEKTPPESGRVSADRVSSGIAISNVCNHTQALPERKIVAQKIKKNENKQKKHTLKKWCVNFDMRSDVPTRRLILSFDNVP